jgi:hypothetical protein
LKDVSGLSEGLTKGLHLRLGLVIGI